MKFLKMIQFTLWCRETSHAARASLCATTHKTVWAGQQLRLAWETYRAIDKIRPVETDKKRVTNSV